MIYVYLVVGVVCVGSLLTIALACLVVLFYNLALIILVVFGASVALKLLT